MTRSIKPEAPTVERDPCDLSVELDLDRPAMTFEELRAWSLQHNPFESDEEVDEFIAWVHAERRRDMA